MNGYEWAWSIHRQMEVSDAKRRKAHLASVRARLKLQQRVEQVEDELAWVSALASSLASVCIEKGIVVEEELKSRIARIDEARAAAAAAEAAKTVRSPRRPRRRPAR
jgi:hypothetical protein